MLTNQQIEKIQKSNIVALGSSDKSNQPRIIYVMPSKIEENRIVISNIQMEKTIKNIEENNQVFVNFFSQEDEYQLKIAGKATIQSDSEEFFEIKNFEETNNLPEDLKVNSIIIVNIESVEESIG